jgi:hypothetical protein
VLSRADSNGKRDGKSCERSGRAVELFAFAFVFTFVFTFVFVFAFVFTANSINASAVAIGCVSGVAVGCCDAINDNGSVHVYGVMPYVLATSAPLTQPPITPWPMTHAPMSP